MLCEWNSAYAEAKSQFITKSFIELKFEHYKSLPMWSSGRKIEFLMKIHNNFQMFIEIE
jgi:hypothetical protein